MRFGTLTTVYTTHVADEHGRSSLKVTADRSDLPIEIHNLQPSSSVVVDPIILTAEESKALRKALKRAEQAHRGAVA